ncbi:uncharacterized protein KY384_005108 [Bacidia gigantensis]|uniref:uncharacterized protein n=1 Tax=Bacidia gigantensis TaxID=2732470 RepID=UPI001D05643D|nr:uncharacterized protein KY384_005108 [Bacidia gigantensis]KAG8529628.1 hypothetical protein KY384_005108 [Bacidia gigantensis]
MATSHMEPSAYTLKDKVAVVTGASSGLGRAIAVLFAAHGTRLVVCADLKPEAQAGGVDQEPGKRTDELINSRHGDGRALYVETNVAIGEDVSRCVEEAVRLGGRLDVMVNNAGLGVEKIKIHELPEEVWDKMMSVTLSAVNLRSVFLGCKYACAQFLKQKPWPSGDRGWIVNTASILGAVGIIDGAVSRTAMTKMNYEDQALSDRLMARTPWRTWGEAQDIAKAALFLASDGAAWITGAALPVDGGFLAA